MTTTTPPSPNLLRFGNRREWVWRGWQIRYTFLPARQGDRSMPMLLLHGFGSSLGQWRNNLLPLSQHHSVYAIDFLGFGASEKAPTTYNVTLWAELVRDFWRTFIGTPAVVVGHSLGALVALNAVASYPEMSRGLVLLTLPFVQANTPPKWARAIEQWFTAPWLIFPLFQVLRQRWVLRRALNQIYTRRELVDAELVELFAIPPRDEGALGAFCALARSRSSDEYLPAVEEMLPRIATPILLLWGERDRIVPFPKARPLLDMNPNLQFVEIPGGGHCAYDEYPQQINQAIETWIEMQVEPQGKS